MTLRQLITYRFLWMRFITYPVCHPFKMQRQYHKIKSHDSDIDEIIYAKQKVPRDLFLRIVDVKSINDFFIIINNYFKMNYYGSITKSEISAALKTCDSIIKSAKYIALIVAAYLFATFKVNWDDILNLHITPSIIIVLSLAITAYFHPENKTTSNLFIYFLSLFNLIYISAFTVTYYNSKIDSNAVIYLGNLLKANFTLVLAYFTAKFFSKYFLYEELFSILLFSSIIVSTEMLILRLKFDFFYNLIIVICFIAFGLWCVSNYYENLLFEELKDR